MLGDDARRYGWQRCDAFQGVVCTYRALVVGRIRTASTNDMHAHHSAKAEDMCGLVCRYSGSPVFISSQRLEAHIVFINAVSVICCQQQGDTGVAYFVCNVPLAVRSCYGLEQHLSPKWHLSIRGRRVEGNVGEDGLDEEDTHAPDVAESE